MKRGWIVVSVVVIVLIGLGGWAIGQSFSETKPAWVNQDVQQYPLCPGEDVDDQGFGEQGGNDTETQAYTALEAVPVPYQCVGRLHRGTSAKEGEPSDVDYVAYTPMPGRPVTLSLSHLSASYSLVALLSCPSQANKPTLSCDYTGVAERGTADRSVVITPTYDTRYVLYVVGAFVDGFPASDPNAAYLLSVSYK